MHGFIVRNALRNKRRLLLTVLSVALSLFLFTTLQTALRELTQPAVSEAAALRIIVRHRVSLANVLPEKYQFRIERMPGVASCSKFTWFGGVYQDEKNFFPQFACEADKLFDVFTEAEIDPAEARAFIKEKTACIVGVKTMSASAGRSGTRSPCAARSGAATPNWSSAASTGRASTRPTSSSTTTTSMS
jgi:putative ABC transport system permease protein